MKKRLRIYVAGAISSPIPLNFLTNLRRGMRVCTELIVMGFAPFCPFLDFMLFFQLKEGEKLSINEIRDYSLAFLPDSRALYVLPGFDLSKGTRVEINEAKRLLIPVFYDKTELVTYLREIMELQEVIYDTNQASNVGHS